MTITDAAVIFFGITDMVRGRNRGTGRVGKGRWEIAGSGYLEWIGIYKARSWGYWHHHWHRRL